MPTAVEISGELESFYRGYIDAFNREDVDHLSDCFALPYAFITGERGLSVTADEGAHQGFFSRLAIDLKARGWARSAIDRLKTFLFADNLAMIVADYTRYKSDGSVLERGRACYTAQHNGKSWKFVALSEVKPPFLGPGDLPRP